VTDDERILLSDLNYAEALRELYQATRTAGDLRRRGGG
jgi:hypothetical protein